MEPEIININELDSGNTININNSVEDVNVGGSKSSNFGSGIELLMNDKMKSGGNNLSGDIDVDDLNSLEDELNELSEPKKVLNQLDQICLVDLLS